MIKKLLATTTLVFAFVLITFAQNSTAGTDFWVGYGHHQFMEQGGNTQQMVLYIAAGAQATDVTVTIHNSGIMPSTDWKRTYHILANNTISTGTTAPLSAYPTITGAPGTDSWTMPKTGPYDCRLFSVPPTGTGSTGVFQKKAIHIESTQPVVAYVHIYGSASSGASLLIPSSNWGYNYRAVNSDQSYASNCFSWMYVVAKEDSTTFKITTPVPTLAMNQTGLQANVSKLITLNKGEIYQVLGANMSADTSGNGGSSSQGYQLTGTLVEVVPNEHNKMHQVAVFCGSSRTSAPMSCGSGGGDNDIQQLIPIEEWGTEYLTAPTSSSVTASTTGSNFYKVMVSDPATVVMRNGAVLAPSTFNNGYYSFQSSTADYITANQPILVAQFLSGGLACLGGGVGDPEMFYLSPLQKAVKKTLIYKTTMENIAVNYVTLLLPTAALGSLKIDGSPILNHQYAHPNMPGYTVAIKRWGPASQSASVIECDSAFVGITYGLGSVESYGYNIGYKTTNYISRTIYHFTGTGNWNDASSWLNGKVPPLVVNAGEEVIIEPSSGECNFSGNITVKQGGKLEVKPGKKLNVTGQVIIED